MKNMPKKPKKPTIMCPTCGNLLPLPSPFMTPVKNPEAVVETFNKEFLRITGYTNAEINCLGDLSKASMEAMVKLIRMKSQSAPSPDIKA